MTKPEPEDSTTEETSQGEYQSPDCAELTMRTTERSTLDRLEAAAGTTAATVHSTARSHFPRDVTLFSNLMTGRTLTTQPSYGVHG